MSKLKTEDACKHLQYFVLVCSLFYRPVMTRERCKWCELGCSLKHRHPRMFLGNMVRQIDYIVVSFHRK